MKAASLSEIKQELSAYPTKKVLEICLKLAKFKKENRELLSFLLFEAHNEHGYVESVKLEIDELFSDLPHNTWYTTKKTLRKILRLIAKYSKHVSNKDSEVEMLIHFSSKMKALGSHFYYNQKYTNMYKLQLVKLKKLVELVHEDIRSDYERQIEQLQ